MYVPCAYGTAVDFKKAVSQYFWDVKKVGATRVGLWSLRYSKLCGRIPYLHRLIHIGHCIIGLSSVASLYCYGRITGVVVRRIEILLHVQASMNVYSVTQIRQVEILHDRMIASVIYEGRIVNTKFSYIGTDSIQEMLENVWPVV